MYKMVIACGQVMLFPSRVCFKIPKISPGAYIFQRPFLRGLFLEGLTFGGAYLRREICVSELIGLYLEGRFNRGFFALPDWGAYINFGGAYTWRGLFSEFYGNKVLFLFMIMPISMQSSIELSASIKQPLAGTP